MGESEKGSKPPSDEALAAGGSVGAMNRVIRNWVADGSDLFSLPPAECWLVSTAFAYEGWLAYYAAVGCAYSCGPGVDADGELLF